MINAGTNIKRLREEKGMTQKELAKLLHIEQHSLSQYETGKRRISLEMFEEIINALGMDMHLQFKPSAKANPVSVNLEAERIFNVWNSIDEELPGWKIEDTGGHVHVASKNILTKSGKTVGVWIGVDGMALNHRLIKDPEFEYDIVEDEFILIEEEDEEVSGIPYWDHLDSSNAPLAFLQKDGWEFTEIANELFTEDDFDLFTRVTTQLGNLWTAQLNR